MSDDEFGLDLPLLHAGKVRRLYEWPPEPDGRRRVLMVATDAVSAFDHVLPTAIPDKGAVLTQLSLWWLGQLEGLIDHHVLSTDVPEGVRGRAVVAEQLDMVPVECVARGYLTGSGWAEYQQSGTVCGVALPEGLVDGSRLDQPIFTPAVKAPVGEHDENVDFDAIVENHGIRLALELRDRTLALYSRAEEIARERGIILADTKFEFGRRADGTLVLADEVLTPDSSRFWDAAGYRPGESLPSFDKQFVRDWLAHESGWDKASDAPPPALPADVVAATRARYVEAFERLTGTPFVPAGGAGSATGLAGTASDTEPHPNPDEVPEPHHVPRADLLVGGAHSAAELARSGAGASDRIGRMARVIVDVMPKPEILDPQGKAVTGALRRLGFDGLTVRQGKRFEIEVEGGVTDERVEEVRQAAEKLLANTVIESFSVRVDE